MADEKAKINSEKDKVETVSEKQEKVEVAEKVKKKKSSPIIWITRLMLLIVAFIFAWYILSDRNTPYTDQARITELILTITPRVSGYVSDVKIKLHSKVEFDDLLFQIDTIFNT